MFGAGRGRRVVVGPHPRARVAAAAWSSTARCSTASTGSPANGATTRSAGSARRATAGAAGCVETVISGPALERHYRELTGRKARMPRDRRPAPPRARRAARATLRRLSAKFGEAIAAVINILDPDAVVIGGGVGNIGDPLRGGDPPGGAPERLQHRAADRVPAPHPRRQRRGLRRGACSAPRPDPERSQQEVLERRGLVQVDAKEAGAALEAVDRGGEEPAASPRPPRPGARSRGSRVASSMPANILWRRPIVTSASMASNSSSSRPSGRDALRRATSAPTALSGA